MRQQSIRYIIIAIATISLTTHLQAQQSITTGKDLFEKKCAKCHGKDGTKGMFGAKNLQLSRINDGDMFHTISNGIRVMPSWKSRLTEGQIRMVMAYIKKLRK